MREGKQRYELGTGFEGGIPEAMSVDGCEHTPYGVSKLCAGLYVQEYARRYGVPAAAFRMSCIYGPRQFGVEDQGWVAHFVIRTLTGWPITIYGDGKQVRDVLYVEDLVRAMDALICRADEFVEGLVCNIGGGPRHAISLLELLDFLAAETGCRSEISFAGWMPSDQRVYVWDIRRAKLQLGWEPMVSVKDGIRSTIEWVSGNLGLLT